MAKIRLFQIAKELEISNKELIAKAQALGYDVRTHSNTLEETDARELKRKIISGQTPTKVARPTVLRRRAVRENDSARGDEVKVILSRLSHNEEGEEEKVLETKRIPIPNKPSFEFSALEQTTSSLTQSEPPPPPPDTAEVAETTTPIETTPTTQSPQDHTTTTPAVEQPAPTTEQPSHPSEQPAPIEEQPSTTGVQPTATKEQPTPLHSPPEESTISPKTKPTTAETTTVESTPPLEKIPAAERDSLHQTSEPTAPLPSSGEEAIPSLPATETPQTTTPPVDEPTPATQTQPPSPPLSEEPPLPPQKSTTEPPSSHTPPQKPSPSLPPEETPTTQTSPPAPSTTTTEPSIAEPSPPKTTPSPPPKQQPTIKEQQPKKKDKETRNSKLLRLEPQFKEEIQTSPLSDKNSQSSPQTPFLSLDESEAEKNFGSKEVHSKKTKQDRFATSRVPATKLPTEPKKAPRKAPAGRKVQEMGGYTGRRPPHKKGKGKSGKKTRPQTSTVPMSEKKRVIKVDEAIAVGELAKRMGVKATELIRKLISQGMMATINQPLDLETATVLAQDFGYEVQNVGFEEAEIIQQKQDVDPQKLQSRRPVVTIMGHVDHGKTSLLDVIRKSHLAQQEEGGITQHIGAYVVQLPKKGEIVFLDTPGHEAFTAMRSRGAQCTDLVILVVAADDGVMPQTVEAINHARAAKVPIVVAVNKIDKGDADPQRVRYSLMEHNLIPEEMGGDTLFTNVSAHTKQGVSTLLENVLLQAELLELKAATEQRAHGVVIEAQIEKGRGPVATVLIQEGTLQTSDAVVAGVQHGRIRAMFDDHGNTIKEAGPSTPVKILGLSGLPMAGDPFDSVADERAARQVAQHRHESTRRQETEVPQRRRLADFWAQQERKELNIILKTDVQGSLEALREAILKIQHEEIEVSIRHYGVGGITENDVNLAMTSDAIIVGFNVRADNKAQSLAEAEGIEIRIYRVIYDALDDIKAAIEKRLTPTLHEKPLGQAEIRKVFSIPKAGKVAGCYVTQGKINRGCLLRLYRENIQIYEGRVATLRRFKDDVKEVATGYECGIQIEGYQDIRVNDIIEAYEIEEITAKLE